MNTYKTKYSNSFWQDSKNFSELWIPIKSSTPTVFFWRWGCHFFVVNTHEIKYSNSILYFPISPIELWALIKLSTPTVKARKDHQAKKLWIPIKLSIPTVVSEDYQEVLELWIPIKIKYSNSIWKVDTICWHVFTDKSFGSKYLLLFWQIKSPPMQGDLEGLSYTLY